MPTVSVSLTFPGRMSDDPRHSVTFHESEFPECPIWMHYLRIRADNGAEDFFNVGAEVGKRYPVEPGAGSQILDSLPPRRLNRAVLDHLHKHYAIYDRRSRDLLVSGNDPEGSPGVQSGPPSRRRRAMTPEQLTRLLVEHREYEAADRAAAKELARDYQVNVSTISRWLAKARKLETGKGGTT